MRRSPLSALLRSFPWRPVPIALAMGVLCTWRAGVGSGASSRDEALVQALAKRGLSADATEVRWIDSPRQGLSAAWAPSARALVRASAAGDLADLYLVRAELSPSGGLVAVHGVYDLTRSPAADETAPVVRGEHALYATLMDGVFTSVHALDLGRDPEPEGRESATRLARAQSALTNYQDTGQLAGIGRRGWSLDPSSSHIDLGFSNDDIAVVADGHAITLPAMGMAPLAGSELVRPQPSARARPGNLVTWAVDRVRNLSWFGDDRMQTVKALTFAAADLVARAEGAVLADTSEKEIAADMGDLANQKPVTYTDPQTGWPPAPMAPYLNPPLPGEGQWVALDRDPFIQTNAGAPPAFVTSYVRTDRERAYTRIYVTVWDPRQVEMHMMAGTVEPVGASGEAGPGLIPRTPEVMRRVVGALNGGFQALHGEFGMMGDGVVYLPPKPYAATVADMRDGSTGFGEWPLSTDIPADILSYRQNLTALVLDEKYNPYGRSWWGGTPPGWKDKTHTVRTGICLTRENFIAYFYGTQIDAEVLAQAMIQARCKFGVHLDMNAGHTGLEFYRVAPAADLGNLGRALSYDWEAEGSVVGMDGWKFRARRMIRVMGLMNFPRYIQREARDFFYLTLRHVLPGPNLASHSGEPEEGVWRTQGLPQHGFPFALATTTVHPDDARPDVKVRVLKIDPRTVHAAGAPGVDPSADTVVVFSSVAHAKAQPALFLANGAFSITVEPPDEAMKLFSGLSAGDATANAAPAAVGVEDETGMLVYAELSSPALAGTGALLDRFLGRMGCTSRMLLGHSLDPSLGGTMTLAGDAPREATGATVRLVRAEAPGAHSIFTDTPIVPLSVWQPLQMQRIRYFKKSTPGATAAAGASRAVPQGAPHDLPEEPSSSHGEESR